jgi:tetratricopeptide (TPR) repeat protein
MLGQALAECRVLGDVQTLAEVHQALGRLAAAQDDLAGAGEQLREALARHRRLGTRLGIAETLEALADLAGQLQEWERAARLLGAAEALREQIGAPIPPVERTAHDRATALTLERLGEEAFLAAWAEGRAMGWEQMVGQVVRA